MKKSGKDVWFITCIDDNCFWRLRERKLDNSKMFKVRRFVSKYTCTILLR